MADLRAKVGVREDETKVWSTLLPDGEVENTKNDPLGKVEGAEDD